MTGRDDDVHPAIAIDIGERHTIGFAARVRIPEYLTVSSVDRDDSAALQVMANQLEAHGRAYRILHAEDRADADGDGLPARVGFARKQKLLRFACPSGSALPRP